MIDDILEFNKKFVESKGYEKYITNKYPDKKIAILSCMDTRLTELLPAALGIRNGDVKIIKNAGGVISHPFGSVIRSLMVAIYELGVKEVIFGLFNETTLSFNTGTTRFSRGTENAEAAATDSENAFKSTETTLYELHLGINPGVAVFIMQNVSAEVSFGVIGFKYSSETQKNNLGETGKRHNSGANFKINLFNINIGITLCL